MTCVQRPNRNSLVAYGHLFEPRPQRRNTLKKRRESVDVQILGLPTLELEEPVPAAGSALPIGDGGAPLPFGLSRPFERAPQTQTTPTVDFPCGWTPKRPTETKAVESVMAVELPADPPAKKNETSEEQKSAGASMVERTRMPAGPKQPPRSYRPRNRFSRPVASFRSYDPNFLMPLPPVKQPQRIKNNHYKPRSVAAQPPLAMSDRYVMTQNSGYSAVGPTFAQPRQPNRRSMTSFDQMERRHSAQEQYARPGSSSSTRSNMSSQSSGAMPYPIPNRNSFNSGNTSNFQPRRPESGVFQRPAPIKHMRQRRDASELFHALPSEVLQVIFNELKKNHMRADSRSCATCMMRDLCSVSLTCRRLAKPAQNTLYEEIQIVGADSLAHKKRFKGTIGTRLVLLRRTLRANPDLATLVRTLKVPALPADAPSDKYQDKVASIIMACPNFERLIGFHQPYDHTFKRLFHALSTRENLKEMNWFLEPAPVVQKTKGSKSQSNGNAAGFADINDFELDMERSTAFFDLHANWSHLTTLTIHAAPGAVLEGVSMLGMALANMPNLENLFLSNLPLTMFNDATLLSLPPLQTLSLSCLPGISSTGLAAFARRPSSHSIRKLTLRHLGIDSLPALGRIFSYLTVLESFTFVQMTAPVMPSDEVIWLYPYFASPSLRKLHWDTRSHTGGASEADRILAKSIASQGYPALRTLRTPNDPQGIFQALCDPVRRTEVFTEQFRGLIARIPDKNMNVSEPSPPMTPKTPMSPLSPASSSKQTPIWRRPNDPPTPGVDDMSFEESNLAQSRAAAQARAEAAKNVPRFLVNVIDEDGTVVDKFGLAGFLGQVGSGIEYLLRPDPGATDENGGLVTLPDLLKDGGEELDGGRQGCQGRWLSFWSDGTTADKREKERWWHTERGRWQELSLS